MTKQEIMKAFEMRYEGYSLQEIADTIGCTRENIRSTFERIIRERKYHSQSCVYPFIAKWLQENGMSAKQLNELAGLNKHPQHIYSKLAGKTKFSLEDVKKIMACTGLTFEEVTTTASGESDG